MDEQLDSTLIRRYAQTRDQDAFRALVVKHQPMVFLCCRAVLGRVDWAEDATQATFLLLHERAHSLVKREEIRSWLIQSARLISRNMKRKEARRSSLAMSEPFEQPVELDEPDVTEAFSRLGVPDQELLWLRFGEQRDFAEIAGALNVTPDSARMRCNRALEKLRKSIGMTGVMMPMSQLELTMYRAFEFDVSEELVEKTVLAARDVSAVSSGVWLALHGAKTVMKTRLYGFASLGVLTLCLIGGVGFMAAPLIQEQMAQPPRNLTFLPDLAGKWTGELEYANYSDDQREVIATESTIEVLPNKMGVKIITTYPGHRGNILETSTITFDKDLKNCALSNVPGKHRVVKSSISGQNGSMVIEGKIKEEVLGELQVVPLRLTIRWTKDSLTTTAETRTPLQFRNETRLKRTKSS